MYKDVFEVLRFIIYTLTIEDKVVYIRMHILISHLEIMLHSLLLNTQVL